MKSPRSFGAPCIYGGGLTIHNEHIKLRDPTQYTTTTTTTTITTTVAAGTRPNQRGLASRHPECSYLLQMSFRPLFRPSTDASPALSYRFIDQTLQPGPPVSLKCAARGSPTPRIVWSLNGFALPKSERWDKERTCNTLNITWVKCTLIYTNHIYTRCGATNYQFRRNFKSNHV